MQKKKKNSNAKAILQEDYAFTVALFLFPWQPASIHDPTKFPTVLQNRLLIMQKGFLSSDGMMFS